VKEVESVIRLNDVALEFEHFPNGEVRVPGPEIDKWWGRARVYSTNRVHFRYETDADLMALLFVKSHLDSLGAVSQRAR
jgi:ribose-phosphate pyrophosphokinase